MRNLTVGEIAFDPQDCVSALDDQHAQAQHRLREAVRDEAATVLRTVTLERSLAVRASDVDFTT